MPADEENLVNEGVLHLINSCRSKKLDLSKKMLCTIPAPLLDLTNLEFLYLEGNQLQSLPDDFFASLIKLKWLDLRKNKLRCLPTTIGDARNLRSLLLEENELKRLPLELGLVESLSGLHLADNPLELPPASVIEQGTQVILAFLREQLYEEREEIKSGVSAEIHTRQASGSSEIQKGRDEAQSISPIFTESTTTSPPLKLPPIFPQPNEPVTQSEPELFKDPARSLFGGNSKVRTSNMKQERRKKSPEKLGKMKASNAEEIEKNIPRKVSLDKSVATKPAKSPTKTSPKRRKKVKGGKKTDEDPTVMNTRLKVTGTYDIKYQRGMDEKSSGSPTKDMEREDTTAITERYEKIIGEEKANMLKVKAIIEESPEGNSRRIRPTRVDVGSLAVGDMVAIKVADKHYIPGQPCLGKVASLPDKTGLVLVHYYSGSYDGAWRPMMSRSSPYLRRVPAAMIMMKFQLTDDLRMTPETVKRLRTTLDETDA